jgi:hypothetical protein
MNELFAYTTGLDATRRLAHSALPDAPVVAVAERPAATRSRSWTAARLHSVARATQQLANRVDPVCATR